jgi:ligand-binding SRPBCC domain-containing protein
VRSDFRIEYTIKWFFVKIRWVTLITDYEAPALFADVQLKGPYKAWRHTHIFVDLGNETLMRDRVQYELPFGILGTITHRLIVARQLKRIFDYRARKIRKLFTTAKALTGAGRKAEEEFAGVRIHECQ